MAAPATATMVTGEQNVSQTGIETNLNMTHQSQLLPRIVTTEQSPGQDQSSTLIEEPIKLFVGQLPKECEMADVHTFFERYGEIVDLTMIKDKSNGKQKGCAFLTFREKSVADTCINELNDKVAFPSAVNPLQIRPADLHEKEYKLFVGMLPKSLDERAIDRIFSVYGELKEVHIIRGPDKQPKGCAFIKYTNKRAALTAIECTNNRLLDISTRPIVVKFADQVKKSSPSADEKHGDFSNAWIETSPYLLPSPKPPTAPIPSNPPIIQLPFRAPPPPRPEGYIYFAQSNHVPIQYPQHAMYHSNRADPRVEWAASLGMENPDAYVNYGGISFDPMGQPRNVMQLMHTPRSSNEQMLQAVGENAESSMERPPEGPPGANLFIYHLPRDLTDADLATLFASFGNVISAKVFVDRKTSESKGFGFVSYDTPTAADDAINAMNGFQIGNKRLKVQHKKA